MKRITEDEFVKKATSLYGEKARFWKVICPNCNTVQSGQDFLNLGIPSEEIPKYLGFSCIGRFTKDKGCSWSLGGFLQIHKLEIIDKEGKRHPHFELFEK
jgi:hypothetical protein